jgi:hypothetical protein
MDAILKTHLVDPATLRTDDFQEFYKSRKNLLIKLIKAATGKTILPIGTEAPPKAAEDDDVTNEDQV